MRVNAEEHSSSYFEQISVFLKGKKANAIFWKQLYAMRRPGKIYSFS